MRGEVETVSLQNLTVSERGGKLWGGLRLETAFSEQESWLPGAAASPVLSASFEILS
jgi:hypothetical protein